MDVNSLKLYFKNNKNGGISIDELCANFNALPLEVKDILEELVDRGFLYKRGKKRLLYYYKDEVEEGLVESKENHKAFANIIGANGSLKNQIQMAKAAVMYPPNGLHTLIIGESGVGKSMFAEEMWKFSKEYRKDNKEIPFVVFNCAEYADNPQLLLSHLFGHVKGAFTGAVNDNIGLVEKANNGILFLDEIHRLSSIGQEMFFTLIDKGIYRRLGDSNTRHVNLMIVGATTENPNSVMLQTFRRRMPVVIDLPTLSGRPLKEHVELINFFLSQEANRLDRAIFLQGSAFKWIISQEVKANVGDLKNILQLCCAKSYCSFQMRETNDDDFLNITVADLPVNAASYIEKDIKNNSTIKRIVETGIYCLPGLNNNIKTIFDDHNLSVDLYSFVDKKMEEYSSNNISNEAIEGKILKDLETHCQNILKNIRSEFIDEGSILSSLISPLALKIAQDILNKASIHFNRSYSNDVLAALALHIQQLKERLDENITIPKKNIEKISLTKYENELVFIGTIIQDISKQLNIHIPSEEQIFLAMFINQPKENVEKHIGLVVVAHGNSTATSMADFVNGLLLSNHVNAVNAPIERDVSVVFDDLENAIKEADEGLGVIILADMGSFTTVQEKMEAKLGIKTRIIPVVSSPIVLEAAKTIISSKDTLDEMYDRLVNRYHAYFNTVFQIENENAESIYAETSNNAAIVICSTGKGSATKLKNVLVSKIEKLNTYDIYPMSITEDVNSMANSLGDHLVFVAGNFDPKIDNVPFFSTESIIMGNGIENIDLLVNDKFDMSNQNTPYSHEDIKQKFSNRLYIYSPSFSEEKILKVIDEITVRIENEIIKDQLRSDVYARLIIHTAALLERLYQKEESLYPEWGNDYLQENKDISMKLRQIFNEAIAPLNLEIDDTDLIYIMLNILPDDYKI